MTDTRDMVENKTVLLQCKGEYYELQIDYINNNTIILGSDDLEYMIEQITGDE